MKTNKKQRKSSENIKELMSNTGNFPSTGHESLFVFSLMPWH